MITMGSRSRQAAASRSPFLAERSRGRSRALKEFRHLVPDFVFWASPEAALMAIVDSHRRNPPWKHEHILDDEPDYGGLLWGRVATSAEGHPPQR